MNRELLNGMTCQWIIPDILGFKEYIVDNDELLMNWLEDSIQVLWIVKVAQKSDTIEPLVINDFIFSYFIVYLQVK